MKKLVLILAILTVGYVVGRFSHEPPAHAIPRGCPADTENGNVNGDDVTDIGDAVYLLNYLFQGGPQPCDNRVDLEAQLLDCRLELAEVREALADCEGEAPLRWYMTCGDPVCRGYTGPFDDIPICTDQVEGSPCDEEGDLCDPEDECNRLMVCARSDPTDVGCPISEREHKRDIRYLSDKEEDRVRDELLELRLATWRYIQGEQPTPERLGFIIDDVLEGVPDAPAVRPDGERVDLYGYVSMAVAAIQSQGRQLDALTKEIAELRALHERGR